MCWIAAMFVMIMMIEVKEKVGKHKETSPCN